jgi:hypothetical protein
VPGDEDDIDIQATLHDRVSNPARRVADSIDEIGDEAEETAAQLAAMAAAEEAARVEAERLEGAVRDQSVQLRDAQKEYDLTSKKLRKLDTDFEHGRISVQDYSDQSRELNKQLQNQKNSIRSLSGHLTRYRNQLAMVNKQLGRTSSETDKVDRGFKRMTNRMKGGGIGIIERFSNTLKNINSKPLFASVGVLSILAFTVLPLLIPAGAALGVAFGGITTAVVGATAATAIWGGVAVAAVKRLMKHQKEAVGPGRDLLNQIKRLKGEWSSFLDHTEGGIFIVLAKGLKIVNDNMSKFEPVVNAVSKSMEILVDDLDKWAKGGGVDKIAKFLERSAKLIVPFGRGLGYMAVGIGHLLEAFEPLAHIFAGRFVDDMERFAKSTENLGDNPKFKQFIQYGLDMIPKFKDLLGSIAEFAWKVILAFKPWADFLLPIVTKIFDKLAELDPMAIAIGIGAIAIAFGILSGGATGVILAIAGIGIILTNLYDRSEKFRNAMDELTGMLKRWWEDTKVKAKEVWTDTVQPALEDLADKIETRFIPAWKRAWPYIKPVIEGLMKFATSQAIETLGRTIKAIAWALGIMVDEISMKIHFIMELSDVIEDVARFAGDAKDAIANLGEAITGIDSGKLGDIMSFAGSGIPLIGGLFFAGGEPKVGTTGIVGEVGPEAFITKGGKIDIIGKNGPELRKFSSPGAVVPASAVSDPFAGNAGNAPDWAVEMLRSRSAELVGVSSGPVTHGSAEPVSGGDINVQFGDIIAYNEMDIEGAVRRGINKAEEDKKERR